MPRQIILFSGHMTDHPDRPVARFPEPACPAAARAITECLREWHVGPDTLGLCGGARGGDILFAEALLDLGGRLEVMLPLERAAFVEASVVHSGPESTAWEARFNAMIEAAAKVSILHPDATSPLNVFAQNNLRLLDHAKAQGDALKVLLLWDGATGDGPGGTADMAQRAEDLGATLKIIAPQDL